MILTHEIAIRATPEQVWDTLTIANQIAQWMHDEPCTVFFEGFEGGKIRIEGTLHEMPFQNKGKVLTWQPPERLVYTYWTTITGTPKKSEDHFEIDFRLSSSSPGETLLVLTQHNVPAGTIAHHWNLYWPPTLQLIRRLVEKLA